MWRLRVGAVLLASVLGACGGDDGTPARTIAFVRTTAIEPESQQAFLSTLEQAGWEVGDNLTVLNDDPSVWAADGDEAAALVEELVESGAELLVALSTTAALSAVERAGDVSILTLSSDPVANGLVSDPREPEGRVTGIAFRVPADRTIDVARQLAGAEASIGLLYPSGDPGAAPIAADMAQAATSLGVALVRETWEADPEAEAAARRLVDAGVDVVIIANSPTTVRAFPAIEAVTAAAGIPVVANTNVAEFAVVVLAPEGAAAYEQLARQAARLLEGSDVAEVPVEDPGAFHLLVRRSVAGALGVEVPEDLLAQADEVDE